jgi:hypothetical protein
MQVPVHLKMDLSRGAARTTSVSIYNQEQFAAFSSQLIAVIPQGGIVGIRRYDVPPNSVWAEFHLPSVPSVILENPPLSGRSPFPLVESPEEGIGVLVA